MENMDIQTVRKQAIHFMSMILLLSLPIPSPSLIHSLTLSLSLTLAHWTVTIASNNGVILQNVHWPGLFVSAQPKKAQSTVSLNHSF